MPTNLSMDVLRGQSKDCEMEIFIISYFYPDGSWAGILDTKKTLSSAQQIVDMAKASEYNDCIFVITEMYVTD